MTITKPVRKITPANPSKRIEAGRLAFEAGRMEKKLYATASSPLEGLIE